MKFFSGNGCIWDRLLGIYCPGCGGTRALKAFLEGQFLVSLKYHPLVGYVFLLTFLFFGSFLLQLVTKGKIKRLRLRPIYLYLGLVITVANCLIRNYLRFRFGIYL